MPAPDVKSSLVADNSILRDNQRAYEYETRQQEEMRNSSQHNFNYLRGDGWSRFRDQEEKLKRDGKPALNLNLILPIITLILGYNVQTRYDLKAIPASPGTSWATADLMTEIIRSISVECGLRWEMAQQVLDSLTANIGGYLAVNYTNEEDPLGQFSFERESPFYHLRDSSNEKYDINKGEYHIRTKWLSPETLYSTYTDKRKEIQNVVRNTKDHRTWADFFTQTFKQSPKNRQPMSWDYIWTRDNLYRVVELWEKETKKVNAVYDVVEDELFRVKPSEKEAFAKLFEGQEQRFLPVKMPVTTIRLKTVLGNREVLVHDEKYDVQNGMFPFIPMYSYWIDGQPLSNVENLKDYQDEHNKRSSQILHILNGVGNSGWWVRRTAEGKTSVDTEDLSVNGTKVGWMGVYDGGVPPTKIEANPLPSGHAYMDEQAKAGIRETSGVGMNMSGQKEAAAESGVLFKSRVQQSETMLTHFFDNVRQSKEILGRYLLTAIPLKYDEERTIRIMSDALEDENIEFVEINSNAMNNITDGDYKLVLGESDKSVSGRQQKFIELMAFAQQMPPELVDWVALLEDAPFDKAQQMAQYAAQVMGQQVQQAQPQQDQLPVNQQEINAAIAAEQGAGSI